MAKYRSHPSALAFAIVRTHPNARFMDEATVVNEARKLDQRCVTSMTPKPHKMVKWKPVVVCSRHYIAIGALRIKLTGLTMAEQYALLWAKVGCWKKANKLQAQFNKQFPSGKRVRMWEAGRVVT